MSLRQVAHGTRNAYTNGGCRCDPCRAANAEAGREGRASRALRRPARHDDSAYHNWSCSCEVCRAAHAAHMREYLARAARRDLGLPEVPEDARSG